MVDNYNDRIIFLDIARVAAIFFVIIIHSLDTIKFDFGNTSNWWISNIYNSLGRWSIPIMVMISGALLLSPNKNESVGTFFKKRFIKVVVPFIFWGSIYSILIYREKIISGFLPLWSILKGFIIGPVYYHLWFIYTILGLYLLTPVLRIYIKNANVSDIKYFLTLWFLTNGVIIFGNNLINIKLGVEIFFFTGYIGYYVLGFYLINNDLSKRTINLLYLLFIISYITTMLGTYTLTRINNGVYSRTFNDYLAPNSIFMSVGMFIFIKKIDWERIFNKYKRLNAFILEASSLSFGIYLVHALILALLNSSPLNINTKMFNPVLSTPFVAAITFIISYAIIKIMKSLPVIKRAVP